MSLIDQDLEDKNNDEIDNKFNQCKKCKKNLNSKTIILFCEFCFNELIKESLDNIKTNLIKIIEEKKKINQILSKINQDLKNDKLNLIVVNKLEIDLLNFKAILDKLEIDHKLNKDAFYLNQNQANNVRKLQNWTLFDIVKIGDDNE